jgi:hypothetical protein
MRRGCDSAAAHALKRKPRDPSAIFIRYSRIANVDRSMPLKPQDIMVVLKLCTYERKRQPMSIIAADLNMSPSEMHAAIMRLQKARLLPGPEMQEKPNLTALEEFLLRGVKYACPAEHGQVTRGLPTSFAAPPLKDEIASGDELPPVWPWRDGETRGIALEPLYRYDGNSYVAGVLPAFFGDVGS